MSDAFLVAMSCGIAAGVVACFVWTTWKYDRAARLHAEQQRTTQAQLDQTEKQIRHHQEIQDRHDEHLRRDEAILDRQEAIVSAAEELVRRLEQRL